MTGDTEYCRLYNGISSLNTATEMELPDNEFLVCVVDLLLRNWRRYMFIFTRVTLVIFHLPRIGGLCLFNVESCVSTAFGFFLSNSSWHHV